MPPEDKEKLGKLEELKSKLFSRNFQTHLEHRDSFTELPKKDVKDFWEEKEKKATNVLEKFFTKQTVFKKFFIYSAVFFGLTLLYAGYIFFAGRNSVSNNNIDISILGNTFAAGGEELPLTVNITNKNPSPLELVDLVIEYPKGPGEDSSSTEHFRESLGEIAAGTMRSENVKLILYGEQGSIKDIKVSIEYRVAGSNAIFVKDKVYEVNITSTPINLTLDSPREVSPNQDVALKVTATLNSTNPAKAILVKLDYPSGFQFVNSTPLPAFGNNVWNLGDLAPGSEHEISISGKMVGVFDGEEKTFKVSTGEQSTANKYSIGVIFNAIAQTVTVKKPFVQADIFINGLNQAQYAIDAKTKVSGEIRYTNNLDTKVDNIVIKAKISGNAYDKRSVSASQGFYESSTNTITWDENSTRELRELNPGEGGSVNFNLSPISLFSASGGILASPTINIDVDISGREDVSGFAQNDLENSTSAVIHLISDVGFSTKALYYSGAFANTGPIPPVADQETTYTIVWTLSNTSNSISNVQIVSSLPAWATFLGKNSPADANLTYNASTKSIVWNADRIAKGAGLTSVSPAVSFQIAVKPSLSQVGESPNIINDAILTGHDDFANVDVRVTRNALTTQLTSDPQFQPGGGEVVAQ
jgi:hypothetical protein